MKLSKLKGYITATLIMAVMESVCLFCIPFIAEQSTIMYITVSVFWSTLLVEIVFVLLSSGERKKCEKSVYRNKAQETRLPGIITFISNTEAVTADILSLLFAGVVICLKWLRIINVWVIITSVSILFLSFNLHCIFNGKNYRYLKDYSDYKKGV